jgi:transposase-like protein
LALAAQLDFSNSSFSKSLYLASNKQKANKTNEKKMPRLRQPKNGKRDEKIQRYLCRDCGYRFS